ncbi:MAG: DNA-protecting protein DprA [Gammaproteobacteria bacterium HGW-Gammaproteobacteria-11]|nr:MAG: DNA-protecting protein DprA [Gammaproteobacteria bacterium HGW-Gammaproteobacteria-11]
MHTTLSEQRQALLVLSLLDGLGARSLTRLLEHIPCPLALLEADLLRLQSAGLSPRVMESLQRYRQGDPQLQRRLDNTLTWLAQPGCHLLDIFSEGYPALLRQIADPPLLLYVRGNPELLNDPQLAMVGSRNPGPHGAATARQFAQHFTEAGLLVTSGMALGIDGACHQGALDAGGPTIAVWGTGLAKCYPRRHAALADSIVARGGALVSEQPLDTAAQAGLFPRRNRIISGLSLGTLVVEASLNSGSLITARLALEQNREVFAMPGSIHSPQAKGCHKLLREGAHLVESANDVLEVLRLPLLAALQQDAKTVASPASPLWPWLDFNPASVDWLSQHSGLSVQQVMQELLDLELQGQVQQSPEGFSRR